MVGISLYGGGGRRSVATGGDHVHQVLRSVISGVRGGCNR